MASSISSTVLKCLVTFAFLILVTRACAPYSYRSIETVLFNFASTVPARQLPVKCLPTCEDDTNGTYTADEKHAAEHIRDPSRCDQYWICLPNGTLFDQPHVCPEGWIVNIDDLVCEPIINDGSDQCNIPDPDCDPSIPKVCYREDTCPPPEDGIYPYADEEDCSVYHACHFGDVDIECDPATPYFNGQECVEDANQCCKCQAVCNDAWTFIPDPFDCQNYYLCQDLDGIIAGGDPYIPTDEERFTCPEGEVFNASTKHCIESQTCQSICDFVIV
ncbi:unnamed protein product [Meganyctiphanes norvegica]|uniref:Chitin-binding type-2 domain-containing protein n=1 Tax=Meganyctiphanes norvegica TaxID=48144 RepID=A0AAV2R3G6_MEGNR